MFALLGLEWDYSKSSDTGKSVQHLDLDSNDYPTCIIDSSG
jgi:hypothetical protein